MENKVTGTIKTITFHNEENGYSVIRLEAIEGTHTADLFSLKSPTLTAVGSLLNPQKGERVTLYGTYDDHPKFGRQLKFHRYEKHTIRSTEGLVAYLSSPLFKGVGPVAAKAMVKQLGPQAIQRLLAEPNLLDTLKDVRLKNKSAFLKALEENTVYETQRIALFEVGLSAKMVNTLLKEYQHEAFDRVKQNPYRLIEEIANIGFERADRVALALGMSPDDPKRIEAFMLHVFKTAAYQEGHTHLLKERFFTLVHARFADDALNVSPEVIDQAYAHLLEIGQLIELDELITWRTFEEAERTVAQTLHRLNQAHPTFERETCLAVLETLESDIVYTETQKEAIVSALSHKVMILNGGPGTGKTTILKAFLEVYQRLNELEEHQFDQRVRLMAPTGKAAKRLSEATGKEATTIHRFLGYRGDGGYEYGPHHKAPGDLFVVDEASMIDLSLMALWCASLPHHAHIVLVGDDAQLPSVAPGQVLRDLLASSLPKVTLEAIHRQRHDSPIIPFAQSIRQGIIPPMVNDQAGLYYVSSAKETFLERLESILRYWIDQGYDLHQDIQVLIPMYKSIVGIEATNQFIQKTFNPHHARALIVHETAYALGDKVLQLTNRPEVGIMNGDQGIIIDLDADDATFTVDFQGTRVQYDKDDADQLTLAYAMSVHKSQGSGFKVVILPIYAQYYLLLKRQLIYTGITRATEQLIIIGELPQLHRAIERVEEDRLTRLKEKLEPQRDDRSPPPTLDHRILDPSIPFKTLGEPKHNLSPYDFMEKEPNHASRK